MSSELDERMARRLWESARGRAQLKGRPFDMPLSWLVKRLRPMACEATGLPLVWTEDGLRSHRNPWAPSLDRRDSSGGYTVDNVQVVCWAYNNAKASFDEDVIYRIADAIVARRALGE